MANTKSAIKTIRASAKKRIFNIVKENKIKEAVKHYKKSVTTEAKDIQVRLAKAFSTIDKAVKTKFLHKKTAARRKSRLAKLISKAK